MGLVTVRYAWSVTNLNKALEGKPKPNTLVDVQKTAIKDGVAFRNNGGGFCKYFQPLLFHTQTRQASISLCVSAKDAP